MAKKQLRVGLLTTLGTNIGDDFIREGLVHVIDGLTADHPAEFVAVNKHEPQTVYPERHPIRAFYSRTGFKPRPKLGPARRLAEALLPPLGFSRFDGCDIILQCGTPVIWNNCSNSEWAKLIWRDVLARLAKAGTPVLNIGGGSCYPWERQPQTLAADADEGFIRLMLDTGRLTTVRDRLTATLFLSLGYKIQQICCPALLAGQSFTTPAPPTRKVLINYMHGGGHYDWGQGIDTDAWQKAVDRAVDELRRQQWDVIFLAHNQPELDLAARLWPDVPRIQPASPQEYFDVVRDAAFGIFNRMHASVAAAGLGVPSVAIGTDTRNLMVAAVGLPALYVKEATPDRLMAEVDDLIRNRDRESQQLLALRQLTFDTYKGLLKPFFTSSEVW